jgi:hypothetical protein
MSRSFEWTLSMEEQEALRKKREQAHQYHNDRVFCTKAGDIVTFSPTSNGNYCDYCGKKI